MEKLCDACGRKADKDLGPLREYEDEGSYHDVCAEELELPEDKII